MSKLRRLERKERLLSMLGLLICLPAGAFFVREAYLASSPDWMPWRKFTWLALLPIWGRVSFLSALSLLYLVGAPALFIFGVWTRRFERWPTRHLLDDPSKRHTFRG
jgi:hypothetical protein